MTLSGETVTVLFTDLVGSTSLGTRLGDEAAQALRRGHDRILRQQFERFGGRVIKGTGDGFMIAFRSARQGLECALAIQQAIAAQHGEGRYLELAVRVGLHTGEPVAEGDDLFGSDVNLAARIVAEAEGGQILVSDVTRLLVRREAKLQFVPAGDRKLKGFPEPVPLFQLLLPRDGGIHPRASRFVGRQEERTQLRERLAAVKRGQGSVVLVAGEPGVGKTRLVSELAIEATDAGLTVLIGRAYERETSAPYLPFVEALQQFVQNCTPDELRSHLNGKASHLVGLLPQLRTMLDDVVGMSPSTDSETERYRLLEAVTDFLLNIAATKPALLFLDDLHWADRSSLVLLQHLSARVGEGALLVVITYRDTEVHGEHPLADLLAEMARQRRDGHIELRPFGHDEAAELVRAILGEPPASQVIETLYAASRGNPFFIEELVRHLREQGQDLMHSRAAVGEWALPHSVRQVIGKRLARLTEEANQLLVYSSIVGRDLSLPKLAAVTGKEEDALLELLDEALAARLLEEEGACFIFSHPLIQETLYQSLSGARRRHLHRRIGEALEHVYELNLEAHLDELAHHFVQALPAGDANKAVDYASRAGNHSRALFAYEEAAAHYEHALQAMDLLDTADDLRRCELLLALGEGRKRAGDALMARETFEKAAAVARKLGAAPQLARAALGSDTPIGLFNEEHVALLEEALAALGAGDSPLRARLLVALAAQLYFSPHRERAIEVGAEAIETAKRAGDLPALTDSLTATHWARIEPEALPERLAASRAVVRMAHEAGDKDTALRAAHWLLVDLLEMGDIEAVDRELAETGPVVEELQHPLYRWFRTLLLAMRAMLDGRLDDAERLVQLGLATGQQIREPNAPLFFGVQLFSLRWDQGRLSELAGMIQGLAQQYAALPAFQSALAFLYCGLGDAGGARRELERAAADDFAALPPDQQRLTSIAHLALACAYLGDVTRAARLYDLLLPYDGRNITLPLGICCMGPSSYYLGVLAATMSRWGDANRHFEAALALSEKMGARPFLARSQYEHARMLLARDKSGDHERALTLLHSAHEAAAGMGMASLVPACRELLRSSVPAGESAT